ncbi:aminodeoxychorismate lyase, partial [Listeria monocytogenes]
MKLFETMRLNHGHIPRLNYHTRRLRQSCSQLGFQFSEIAWYS